MRRFVLVLIGLLVLMLSACTPSFVVRVDSIVAPQQDGAANKYYLDSGMNDISRDDLYFQEFSEYLRVPLAQQGLQAVDSKEAADMLLLLNYGMSEGSNVFYTVSRPVYQLVGGETLTYRETKTDSGGGKTVVTNTVYVPLQYHYMGNVAETDSQLLYTGFFAVEARPLNQAQTRPLLWKLTAKCTSSSSDLRRLMPLMVQAATPYFNKNTGTEQRIEIKELATPGTGKTTAPAAAAHP